MRFHAIFFDFDGVVVLNSPRIAAETLASALASHDVPVTTELLLDRYTGVKGEDLLADLRREFRRELPPSLLEDVRRVYRRRVEEQAVLDPSLMGLLSTDILRGICSSNARAHINAVLSRLDLKRHFPDSVIQSSDELRHAKPAPGVYLRAIEALALAPVACCAVEDSEVGLRAAQSAGLTAIGYVGGLTGPEQLLRRKALTQAGAECVVSSFAELAQVIT